MVNIISRAGWGFDYWLGHQEPTKVNAKTFTGFMIHYEGYNHCGHQTGAKVPKAIHRFHRDGRKWAGIGYHFVIDNAGNIYEGRGLKYIGAHCPNFNRSAFGVQIHIGGDEKPSQIALDRCQELYNYLCNYTGKTLKVYGHKDGRDTSCPGKFLYQWKNTLKRGKTTNLGDDEMTTEQAQMLKNIWTQTYQVWRGGQYINLNQEVADCKTIAMRLEEQLAKITETVNTLASEVAKLKA